eukprot:7376277-Prymnesium_polylepis.1
MDAVRVADEVAENLLEVLDGPAALVEVLQQMCGVPRAAGKIGLVCFHLDAHLHRLIGGVVVSRGQRRSLAPRTPRHRFAELVPLVLEVRVDVARLGGGDEQPVLVMHKVGPRRIGCRVTSVEDEQPWQDAEAVAVPKACRKLWVACHLTNVQPLPKLLMKRGVARPRAVEKLTHLGQRGEETTLLCDLLVDVALEAAEEGDLWAALALHLPLSLAARWHQPFALKHLIEIELHLVRVAMRSQTLRGELGLVSEQLANCGLPCAHAGEEHARTCL